MHPGAGAGGVQVLSDMQGVDFNAWLHRWYYETEHTWDPLIPDEVNPPILKQGQVQIRFRVGPNGRGNNFRSGGGVPPHFANGIIIDSYGQALSGRPHRHLA